MDQADQADPTLPSPADPSDGFSWIMQQRRAAQAAAIPDLDDNPEGAARAMQLSRASGVDPSLIYGNLDEFQQQHKAAITSSLLTNNQYLRDYVLSHPLAPKVSEDDWGQLDAVSQAVEKFKGTRAGQILRAPQTVFGAAAQGFKEGFGPEQFGSWLPPTGFSAENWALLTTIGLPFEAAGRVFSGVVEAARQGSEQAQVAFGAEPNAAARRSQEFAGMVEAELGGLSGTHPMPEVPAEVINKVRDAGQVARPWVEAGAEPPVGLHPLIDQIHAEQAKQDLKNYDELFKEVQGSATKERSPELLANFIKLHTDARIGIDAEAIRKLYGDAQPEKDDNKLGWIPDIHNQLALAEAYGGDVEVPLADWLAKVDPEVAKELHDNLRVRPGGMTLEEAKEGSKPVELTPEQEEFQNPYTQQAVQSRVSPSPVIQNAVDAARQAAGVKDPLLTQPTEGQGIIPKNAGVGEVELATGEKRQARSFLARDALDQVDKNQLTGVPRALKEFFEDRLDRMAGDTPVWVVDRNTMSHINTSLDIAENVPGFYHPDWHAIVMADDVAGGAYGHGIATHIMYHELTHGATTREMDANPKLKAAVRQMMNETDAWLQANDAQSRKVHNYAFKNEHEFIAEAFSNPRFQEVLATTPISDVLGKKLGLGKNIKTVWDVVRGIVKDLIKNLTGIDEIPDTILDGVMRLGPTFEEAGRRLKGKGGEVHGAEPMDRDLFTKAAAIGMTKDQYARYQELIAKRDAEDLEHQKAQADKLARQQQTKEWKENFASTRKEVEADLRNRPDLAADRFLRTGELYGEKTRKVRLAQGTLTDEQRQGIPRDFLGTDGAHPDDLAGLFGYGSGDQLVSGLKRLEQERQLEGLTPAAHFSRLVDAETDRQMRQRFGDLESNILEEAKDHVISQTQMDMLHQDLLALGTKAGGDLSISKDDLKQWVKQEFDRTPIGRHSSDKYLAAAGRAGKEAELALLEGREKDAFKAKQQQYISMLLANEAKKLEKLKSSFDKLAKRFSKRVVSGMPAEYTNWIHDILTRTGNLVRRSVQDLEEAKGREYHQDLRSFVDARNDNSAIWDQDENNPSDFKIMPVADFLLDPDYRKPIDDMNPEEFRAVNNSIRTLVKNGQEDNKVRVGDEKADLKATVGSMLDQLKALFGGKEKQYAFGHKDQGVGHAIRTYWASLLQIESIFNRFDKGDPKGLFKKVVTEPIFEGAKNLNTLETKYSKLYKDAVGDLKKEDLNKRVENPLIVDPLSGERGPMTRGNLLAVLQNVGNPSQLDKLARGYKVDKDALMQWVFQNTTKEDWDRAQKIGDVFAQAFEESSIMYHELSGVAPEKIDLREIQTPFGTYKGWYHPVIYDPLRPGSSKKLMGPAAMEDGGYFKAATPSGYTKKRTGYAAPILLNFDMIPHRLRAILNDIAMRPSVTEVSKIFYNDEFKRAINKYYGKEIGDLFIPYLRDVAGQKQYKDAAQSTALRVLENARQNVTATLIGLNPSTVLKHAPTAAMLSIKEVGARNFFRELTGLLSMNDDLGERNWNFAMHGGMINGERWGGSEELQRRHRNWQETLSGAQQDVFGPNTLRNTVIKMGATPVALSDLLSAVPTWLAAYKEQIRQGATHGDAVALADRAVRRAHGSSAVAARPRIMRGGPLAQLATPFYTFFNEMFQRQYEMAWRAKDALGEFSEGNYKAGLKEVPNLMGGLWAYVVFPALIEQLVSPVLTGNQSTTEKVAGWFTRTVASGLPGIRDLAEAFLGGRDPTVGLYSTSAKMLTDVGRDVAKGNVSFDKRHAGTTIKHTITAFGALSGLTNAQEGRTAEFVYDYATGQQRPRDIGDIMRGLWHGQMREQRR